MSQRGFVLWFTGLSGAGKTTIANNVEPELERRSGSRRRIATRTSPASAGSPRGLPARAPS
jgi:ribose 1,5-bisphosphokinase PhnN